MTDSAHKRAATADLTPLGRAVLVAVDERADQVGLADRDAIARSSCTSPQGASRALGRLRELELVEQTLPGSRSWFLTRAGAQSLDELNGSPRCRSCGCTNQVGCDEGCCWLERDLCSSCAEGTP